MIAWRRTGGDIADAARSSLDRPRRLVRGAQWVFAALSLLLGCAAGAQTFRCEVDGRVTYGDQPCVAGKQTSLATAPPVDPAARAAAIARQRKDEAAIARAERERQQDQKAAAASRRRDTDVAKHAGACSKLARRARDAHDRFATAGPRDQPRDRLKMQRADEDYAALCKR